MYYYFDESGNWSGSERQRLLIGGLLFKEKLREKDLDREFRILMAENKIKSLHANELSDDIRELCYQVIDTTLNRETKVLVRIYRKDILRSKTTRNYDEIYSDCAAGLINTITFGDHDIKIFYDLKFHYAYPLNILRNLSTPRPRYYNRIKKLFNLSDETFFKARETILNNLKRRLKDKRTHTNDKKSIENFIKKTSSATISIDTLDQQTSKKINDKKRAVKTVIEDYLWSELWLQMEGSEQAREKFRSNILAKVRETQTILSTKIAPPSIELNFYGKQKNSAGVTAIDFICNLVYRHGTKAPVNASNSVKSIFSKIAVEEIR